MPAQDVPGHHNGAFELIQMSLEQFGTVLNSVEPFQNFLLKFVIHSIAPQLPLGVIEKI